MITKAEAGKPHWESCASHTDSALDSSSTTSEGRGHQGHEALTGVCTPVTE